MPIMGRDESIAAARAWLKKLEDDAHWARTKEERDVLYSNHAILDSLLYALGPDLDPAPFTFQGRRFAEADVYGDRKFAPREQYSQSIADYARSTNALPTGEALSVVVRRAAHKKGLLPDESLVLLADELEKAGR